MKKGVLLEQAASLLPIRRALVVTVLFVPWAQMALTLMFNQGEYTNEIWGFYVYTALYAVVALVTSQRGFALFGPLLPTLLIIAPWFLEGNSWINVNVAAMAATVLCALILRPIFVVAAAAIYAAIFVAIVQAKLPTVLVTGAMLNGGVFLVIQILAASAIVSFTWHKLNTRASSHDASVAQTERQLMSMRLRQDRLAHWRRVSSRLHETVLDLLTRVRVSGVSESTDLSKELLDLHDARSLKDPLPRVVVEEVARDFQGRLDVEFVADQVTAETSADMATAELLRDALYEFCIAARHAGANKVIVFARTAPQKMLYVFTDNSGRQTSGNQIVGDFAILKERIRTAGATMTLSEGDSGEFSLSLVIPSAGDTPVTPVQSDFRWGLSSAGDRTIAAVMLSVLVGALPVAILLQYWWSGAIVLAMLWAAMSAALLAAFFLSKSRLNVWSSAAISSLSLATMLLTAEYAPNCAQVAPVHFIANSTGYALLIVFFIGSRAVASVAIALWFVVINFLITVLPDECESIAWYAVANTLLLVPFGILLLYVSLSTYKATKERTRALERERDDALLRDEMVHDVVVDIENLLEQADVLLRALAVSPHDPTLLHRLRVVESQLRIRAQVDPLVTGAMARGLIAFVDEVAAHGNWLDLGAISGSQYQREIPRRVVQGGQFLAGLIGSGRKLRMFTTEQDEIITLTLNRHEADALAERLSGWPMTNSGWVWEGVCVDLDLEASTDPQAPVLFVLSRSVELVPGLGIPDRRAQTRV